MIRQAQKLDDLTLDELLALDQAVLGQIKARRKALESALSLIDNHVERESTEKRRRGVKKGTKLEPKYVGPDGETWSGRGLRPRWLTDLIKRGHKLDTFLVQ